MQQNIKCTALKYVYHTLCITTCFGSYYDIIRVHHNNTDKIQLQFVVFYQYSCKSFECTLIKVAVATEKCK
jgi:hypothetical protein